jgi:hypothetical protein
MRRSHHNGDIGSGVILAGPGRRPLSFCDHPSRRLLRLDARGLALRRMPLGISRPRRRVRITEAQVLGDVETPSHEAAEAAAGRQFELTDEQRSRLVVLERG